MAGLHDCESPGGMMYNNQWFERSRVARMYSSVSSASDLHARSELMSDFGVFARNFLNECNVDKRNIATSSDGELFKYDLISSNADNEGWADGIWMTLSLSRLIALLGDTGTQRIPKRFWPSQYRRCTRSSTHRTAQTWICTSSIRRTSVW